MVNDSKSDEGPWIVWAEAVDGFQYLSQLSGVPAVVVSQDFGKECFEKVSVYGSKRFTARRKEQDGCGAAGHSEEEFFAEFDDVALMSASSSLGR